MRALWGRSVEVFVASPGPSHEALLYVCPTRRIHLPPVRDPGFAQAVYEAALEHQIDVIAPVEGDALITLEWTRDCFEHAGVRLLRIPSDPEPAPAPSSLAGLSERVAPWLDVPGAVASSLQELCASLRPRRLVEVD